MQQRLQTMWKAARSRWDRIAATLLGAAVLSILSPPLNWHWLHWVAYLPMFWAMREEDPRGNRWLSWLYGIVGVGLLFRWIVHTITVFSPIPKPGALAILLLFAAVFGLQYLLLWPAVHPLRKRLGTWWVLAFPALEIVIEWLCMKVLLFPYNHGVSQYRVPWTWQIVSVTGVWGASFVLFLVNSALAEVIYRRREGRPLPVGALAGAGAVLLATVGFGAWRTQRVEQALQQAPVLRVAQLQSDKDMEYRMTHSARSAFEEWVAATRAVPPGSADLVVWPEGACPYDLNEIPERINLARQGLGELARRGGFELLVGGGTRLRTPDPEMGEDRVDVFNSVYFFRKDGTVSEPQYDKMVPLPFGEYLPFGDYFPELGRTLNIGDFRAGTEPVLFDSAIGEVASPICYEAILPDTARQFHAADLLAVVTNDAWFGDTANPHQHAMLAATRATELGIPMFRSAYTGISLVVEPHGAIHSETDPFEAVSRVVEVRLAKFDTLYARWGNWFVGVCGLGLVIALAIRGQAGPSPSRPAR
jgi:apolipoprotein N-acyltransferase